MTGKQKVDRINRLRVEIARLESFLSQISEFPIVVFAKRGAKPLPFYEQTEESAGYPGWTRTLDVPTDIDATEILKTEAERVLALREVELSKLYGDI